VAVAAVSIQTLDAGVTMAAIKRELGMSRRDLRRLTSLLRIGAAAAAAALATLATRFTLRSAHAMSTFLVCAAVFGVVYLVTAAAVGAVSKEEKASLSNLLDALSRRGARFRISSATES
jgi:hypothetical protein